MNHYFMISLIAVSLFSPQLNRSSMTVAGVVAALDGCPTYLDVADMPPANREGRRKLDDQISAIMRQLQPVPRETLEEAINFMLARTMRGTLEYAELRKKQLKRMRVDIKTFSEEEIEHYVKAPAFRVFYALIWVDRFLFDAPTKEPYTMPTFRPLPLQPGNGTPDGFVNRLYPVEVTNGTPHIMRDAVLYPGEGRLPPPSDFRDEFVHYANVYPRRLRWW